MTVIKDAKLTYFNGRGRGELIRYILHQAQIPFDDNRIPFANWPQIKPTMPLCQVPVFEFKGEDGKSHVMVQSSAIARSLARWNGLYGTTPCESSAADEAFECLRDVADGAAKFTWENDPAKKEKLGESMKTDVLPRNFEYLEKVVKENGGHFIAGNSFTYADFYLAIVLYNVTQYVTIIPNVAHRPRLLTEPELESKYPNLNAVRKAVEALPNIAKYLADRTPTNF